MNRFATNRRPPHRLGLSLVELLVCVAIIGLLVGLTMSAVQRVRASAARVQCADRLRQLGLAAHGHHADRAALPPGMGYQHGPDAYPYMSWLTRLLPYLEQAGLWREAKAAYQANPDFLSQPHHVRAVAVKAFLCPADPRVTAPASVDATRHPVGYTSYLGVEGRNAGVNDGLLYADSRHRLGDAADGTSNTLLAGERPPNSKLSLGWWYAGWGQRQNGDAEFLLGTRSRCYNAVIAECPEGPYHFTPGRFDNPCDAYHFWSPHPGGAHFLFADGSVRFLSYGADEIMPALSTRAGGEAVTVP